MRKPAILEVEEYGMQEKLDIPTALAASAKGAVWFTIDSSQALGVIENGTLRRVDKGSRNVEPLGIGVDSKGDVWITDAPATAIKRVTASGEVSAIDSSQALGVIENGTLRRVDKGSRNVEPLGIGIDSKGDVWITDAPATAIKRVTANGEVSAWPLNTGIARLGRLTVAPDDSVWFAESTAYGITRLKDGQFKRHEFPPQRGGPFGVAAAADGTVWATMQSGNLLLRISPDGQVAEFEVPTRSSSPTDIAVDAQGRPWFIQFRGNKVGVLDKGVIVEYDVPVASAGLSGIATAPDGSVWFGMLRANALGRIRNGKVDMLPFPRPQARPFSLATDAQGNVWYADISGYVGKVLTK